MKREEYKELEIEIIEFDSVDVITASEPDVNDPNMPGGGWG